MSAEEVGHVGAFLSSPLASGVTGATIHVDKGFHAMGKGIRPQDRLSLE
jgi:enoyl-[acyl-carrier protein] reductase I